jgi:hypothetical protein
LGESKNRKQPLNRFEIGSHGGCEASLFEFSEKRSSYLAIEFDDETEILIEVECRPWFGITHLARDTHGELEPVKESMHGAIRSLAKDRR